MDPELVEVPEEAEYVDTPQTPATASWSWDRNTILIAVAIVAGVGLALYAVVDFSRARAKFAVTAGGESSGSNAAGTDA